MGTLVDGFDYFLPKSERDRKEGESLAKYKARINRHLKEARVKAQLTRGEKSIAHEFTALERAREGEEEYRRRRLEADKVIEQLPESGQVDIIKDIIWVYENLGAEDIRWTTAPSRGAPRMLEWARTDDATTKSFYERLMKQALDAQAAREKADRERKRAEEANKRTREQLIAELDPTLEETKACMERLLRGRMEDGREGEGDLQPTVGSDTQPGNDTKDGGDPGLS